MKTNISYPASRGAAINLQAAIRDCVDYLGAEKFRLLMQTVVALLQSHDDKGAEFCIAFVGIEGYPAQALIAYGDMLGDKHTAGEI
jgi:hypothetical protein